IETVTDCCAEIKKDIFDTQTLIIDDFQQTWTILAGLDLNCSTTVIIDLNGVFTAIADVKNTLTECCAEIKSDIFDTQTLIIDDFRQTWTILAGLNFNCPSTVVIDLSGVFTAIAQVDKDVLDTKTLIITDFAQTWTI